MNLNRRRIPGKLLSQPFPNRLLLALFAPPVRLPAVLREAPQVLKMEGSGPTCLLHGLFEHLPFVTDHAGFCAGRVVAVVRGMVPLPFAGDIYGAERVLACDTGDSGGRGGGGSGC